MSEQAPRPPTVDVHAHIDVPQLDPLVRDRLGYETELAEWRATFGARSGAINAELNRTRYRAAFDDPHTRVAWMDRAGIDLQVISVVPTHYHYWAEPDLAADIAASATAHVAEAVAAVPERLVGLATVPIQHPELAARQLTEAHKVPGIVGVEISTHADGTDLSDPSLDVFWAAAQEHRSLVFVHPWGCGLGSRLATAYLGNIVGNPTETTLALSHLVFGGVLDRHPGLRILAAHGGGYFPHYLGRADHAYHVRPESRTMQRPPSAYLDRLLFDSLVHDAAVLERLVTVAGARRIVLGSDYPFDMGVDDPVARLDQIGLPRAPRDLIAGGTAAELIRTAGSGRKDDPPCVGVPIRPTTA